MKNCELAFSPHIFFTNQYHIYCRENVKKVNKQCLLDNKQCLLDAPCTAMTHTEN